MDGDVNIDQLAFSKFAVGQPVPRNLRNLTNRARHSIFHDLGPGVAACHLDGIGAGDVAERRTTLRGRYFHVAEAILEAKPVRKPHPSVLIAGGGEQLTLRAVARLGEAGNIGGDPEMVRHKLAVLRRHCEAAGRNDDAVEMTHNNSWLLARDAAGVASKRDRLSALGPLRGFVGTVCEALDLIGSYRDAGV